MICIYIVYYCMFHCNIVYSILYANRYNTSDDIHSCEYEILNKSIRTS